MSIAHLSLNTCIACVVWCGVGLYGLETLTCWPCGKVFALRKGDLGTKPRFPGLGHTCDLYLNSVVASLPGA